MAPESAVLPEHCYYCFDSLVAHFENRQPFRPTFEDEDYPLFVTWNLFSTGSPRLRGCIGNFEPQGLWDGLREYALTSAFKDRRFNPISEKELPRLECGVSLLTDFEDADDYLDWTLGEHGIYIHVPNPLLARPSPSPTPTPSSSSASASSSSLASPPATAARRSAASRLLSTLGGGTGSPVPASPPAAAKAGPTSLKSPYYAPHHPKTLTATYLPDVAPAQGWTKREAIDSCIRKAGFDGRITEDIRRSLRLTRYRAQKVCVNWEEYRGWLAKGAAATAGGTVDKEGSAGMDGVETEEDGEEEEEDDEEEDDDDDEDD